MVNVITNWRNKGITREHDNTSPKINNCRRRQSWVIRRKKWTENIILIKMEGSEISLNKNDIEQYSKFLHFCHVKKDERQTHKIIIEKIESINYLLLSSILKWIRTSCLVICLVPFSYCKKMRKFKHWKWILKQKKTLYSLALFPFWFFFCISHFI